VRIAWTEPDGKPGLGYLSMDSGDAEKLGKKTSGPLIKNFIDDVFRVVQWAKAAAKKDYRADDWAPFHEEVHDCLLGIGVLNATSKIHELHKQAMVTISACAQTGLHKSQRRAKNQEKVKAYLESNILFAIKNGLTDDEIQDIIKVAFVKHTMES
jgi:hypothetical protein